MFFYHEGDTLYLKAWEYNTTLVLEKLAKIIEAAGGRVKSATKGFIEYQREDREGSRREASHLGYMSFILDGNCYYVQFDDNQFFDHYFSKVEIKEGKVAKNHYLDKIEARMQLDEKLTHYECSEEVINKTADELFNMLIKAPLSKLDIHKKRKTVPNTYDGGTHYEWVYEKPLYEAVGF